MRVNYKLLGSDEIKVIEINNMDEIKTHESRLMAEGAIARYHGVSVFSVNLERIEREGRG